MKRWLLALAIVVAAVTPADSHITATGLARLSIEGDWVDYSLTVVTSELPDQARGQLAAAANGDRDAAEALAAVFRSNVGLMRADIACRPGRFVVQGSQVATDKISMRMRFSCPGSGRLRLREDWSGVFGEHYRTIVSVARITGGGEFILGEDRHEAEFDASQPLPDSLGEFVWLGVAHILSGYDHLLFLLALLVAARGLWSVVRIVTAFTIAHSVTLSAAVFGWAALPASLVEPLIAASIVWVAAENVFFSGNVGRRWLIAFIFGLVHGFGFASALSELELPRAALARALVGFNVGVEAGQLVCVIVVLPILGWIIRRFPRAPLMQAVSLLVAGFGLIWLVERVFFA